jgi:hypothetical protein
MVAFSSGRAALEWCLTVQEAALYLNWPHGLGKIPQVTYSFVRHIHVSSVIISGRDRAAASYAVPFSWQKPAKTK